MASDSKPHVVETGTVPAAAASKPSFGSRVAAHFKRWWWVHLIILIVVVLVVVLPVYVAILSSLTNIAFKPDMIEPEFTLVTPISPSMISTSQP